MLSHKHDFSAYVNPINLAVEKGFYRLPILSEEDEVFIEKFIEAMPNVLHEANKGWLESFSTPSRVRRKLENKNISVELFDKIIADAEIQAEESLHSRIEGQAIYLLDKMRSGDSEIWDNENSCIDLAFFMAVQHFRTKKIRDRVIEGFDGINYHDLAKRCWPILRIMMATNLGWSLYSERDKWQLRNLVASGGINFITGDQPINNIKSGGGHYDLALLYPVTTTRAVLLEPCHERVECYDNNELSDREVHNINKLIYRESHEQVFGHDLDYLKDIFKNKD